jgi:hypothetical protein
MSAGARVRGITKPTKIVKAPCHRCDGSGVFHTYGQCFRCGGQGADPTDRLWGFPVEWTDEEVSAWVIKREARNAKARARAAERAEAKRNQAWTENLAEFPQLEALRLAYYEGLVTREFVPEWGFAPDEDGGYRTTFLMPEFCGDILDKARKYRLSALQVAALEKAAADTQARMIEQAEALAKDEHRDYLAPIGDRITVQATIVMARTVDTQYGLSKLVVLETEDGSVIKTFGTAEWLWSAEQGDLVQITGTVKDHDTYNGFKQTVLTRTKGDFIEDLILDRTA